MRSPIVVGVLVAIAAAVLFGIGAPVIAWAGQGVGAFATACLLYAGAAIVGWARWRGSMTKQDLPRLSIIAVCGAAIAPALLVIGLQRAGALTASLLLNLEAIFTVVIAAAVTREHVAKRVWLAVVIMAAGGAALSFDAAEHGTGGVIGALAVIGATLAWALDNNLTAPLSSREPFDVVASKATLGAALTGIAAVIARDSWPSLAHLAALLACGATAYGISLALYITAQRRIGAARTGSVFALAPFIGASIAWMLGERALGVWALVAIALFVLGVYLHVSEQLLVHTHLHRHGDGEDHSHTHDPPFIGEHSHEHAHTH
ncbi:MAG: DMT family transporter [Kofleriaceae bacterium]